MTWKAHVENYAGRKVEYSRTDNETEYIDEEFMATKVKAPQGTSLPQIYHSRTELEKG